MRYKGFLLGVISVLCAAQAQAACPDRAAVALADLEQVLGDELTDAQQAQVVDILYDLCAPATVTTNAQGAKVYQTVSPATQDASSDASEEEQTNDDEVSLLGIKIRRANEDSKGHERLRRKR